MGNQTIGPGTPRSYRTFDFTAVADARTAAFTAAMGIGSDSTGRALRAERRHRGGPCYDLLRHIGLFRRLRQSQRQHPATRTPVQQGGRLAASTEED